MIGLDTNVLIRLLVEDDPRQARQARELVANAAKAGERFRVDPVVLCEVVWVLRSAYRIPKPRIVDTLDALLSTVELETGEADSVRSALGDFRAGKGDFADYVIARRNRSAGCEATATFDRSHRDDSSFRVLAT
ncbi:MAG: PIN domain-containing protein [Thermoanaerobaculia bacterium]